MKRQIGEARPGAQDTPLQLRNALGKKLRAHASGSTCDTPLAGLLEAQVRR
jgi:hypothetical protein